MAVSSVNVFSGESNWLATTLTNIKNSENQNGIMGALQNMSDGSVSSFLSTSKSAANAMATISQTNVTNSSKFYAQIANQALQDRAQKKQEEAFKDLQRTQSQVQPKNVLDSYIYFDDGTSLDTENNILTMSDGTRIDTVTGAEVVDPSSIIQMANGAYLNTSTNVLTMSDGTKIDTVTGMKLSDLKALDAG